MDEAFWSNVVKRWSEASETVINLKKELAKVHEERELYRDVVQNLRKTGGSSRPSGSGHTRHESGGTVVVNQEHASSLRDELKDAELGLGRAKEEYRRLQKELTEATAKIRSLTAENAQLVSIQQQELAAACDERQQVLKLQKDLGECRSENQHLLDKLHQLEQEMALVRNLDGHGASDRTPTIGSTQPSSLKFMDRQMETLKESVQSTEAENNELRLELEVAEGRFYKAEERNKTLMKSIMKLQDIARHSTGSLRASSANFLTSSPRSRKTSLMSTRSNVLEAVENTKRYSSSSAPQSTSNVEDLTIVDSHPVSMQAPFSLLPEERHRALAKLPVADVKEATSDNLFDREFLKGVLGSLTGRNTSERQGNTDRKVVITSYLCPTLNHHPWCPALPGQHGYIFVGLGKEKETYKTPVIRNLFVGMPKNQSKQRRFRYLGKYKVMRVRSLSQEEWNALSSDTKLMYAKLTKEKTKDIRSAEDILESYDRGDFNVPCVMLQYLSFDDQLYQALITQRDTECRI